MLLYLILYFHSHKIELLRLVFNLCCQFKRYYKYDIRNLMFSYANIEIRSLFSIQRP